MAGNGGATGEHTPVAVAAPNGFLDPGNNSLVMSFDYGWVEAALQAVKIQEADTSLSCSMNVGGMGTSAEGMVEWKEYVARVLHESTVAYAQIRGTS